VYVCTASISNLKSIDSLSWSVPREEAAGWHVILGDNGAGKSSLLKAIALALVGPESAKALRLRWENWVRNGKEKSAIDLAMQWSDEFDSGQRPERITFAIDKVVEASGADGSEAFEVSGDNPFRSPQKRGGGFSAAYGPFRRFGGGDREYDSLVRSYPRLARHLSLFDERVALTECLDWLKELRFQQLEDREEGAFLDHLKNFVNQEGFLPFGTRLHEISSKEVSFIDGNGCRVGIEELSDGYRSILSMTFELIRQLSSEYGSSRLFSASSPNEITLPGVVLIDEVDAHLHPTWQRRIGLWFRRHFPEIQFIVTTHSPLVCQAAEVGTVFRLPAPGSLEEPRMVRGQDLERVLYGDILDAYATGIFGQGITRSQQSRERLERLAHLNLKELNEGLSLQEEDEQQSLRATLPTAAHVLDVKDAADS
jgi:energy-coupling factor transporter ATP-binding protein EcfA2